VIAVCARCREELALHSGRPRIVGGGRVELFCGACWELRDAPVAVVAPVLPTRIAAPVVVGPSRARQLAVAAAAFVLGSLGVVVATRNTAPAAAVPAIDVDPGVADEQLTDDVRAAMPDDPAPAPVARIDDAPIVGEGELEGEPGTEPGERPVPTVDEESLAEQFPTLKAWIHPVTDSNELVPVRSARKFGARRWTIDRADCGAGHCGVDLAGPRGRPVVAVAWGTVVRVERSENGRDGKTGRYVRIEHPDGVFTAYMHLDSIAPGLAVGDEVDAGRVIGTLGKSAIFNSEEHLHFALEVTVRGSTKFVDPTPFLANAEVEPIPARAEGADPAARRQW
jgi:murein DD-endopeptidase MepM/ murein hydrolase activator NlpD